MMTAELFDDLRRNLPRTDQTVRLLGVLQELIMLDMEMDRVDEDADHEISQIIKARKAANHRASDIIGGAG